MTQFRLNFVSHAVAYVLVFLMLAAVAAYIGWPLRCFTML